MTESPRYLGRPSPVAVDDLDVLALQSPVDVSFRSAELTAICPVTDQPDFYTVAIHLIGASVTVESKSLKLYLRTWDQVGILAEDLASSIADRVWTAVDGRAEAVTVELAQARRGGIDTEVTVHRPAP
jgi:7-cyano-7-deazaguanine reductase